MFRLKQLILSIIPKSRMRNYLIAIVKYTETLCIIYCKVKSFEFAEPHSGRVMFGSSHGEVALGRENLEQIFNLCSESQDLESSVALYKHLVSTEKNIKEVFLWFSIFSPGFNMNDTREKARKSSIYDFIAINRVFKNCILYKLINVILYNVNFSHRDGHVRINNGSVICDELTARRAKTHIEMYRKNTQWDHLAEFIGIAQKCDHEVTIILSPARSDYKKYCNKISFDKNYLIEKIPYKLRYKVNILDLFNNSSISDSEFSDCDHLKNVGRISDLFDGALRMKSNS